MSKVFFPKPFSGFEDSKNYLVLVSPEKIPHLVLVTHNKYYSLTYKEAELGKDAGRYLDLLKRLNKAMLVFDLHADLSKIDVAEMIFELIPELNANKLIGNCYHLRLENFLSESGEFELRTYTKEMIFSYIQQLKEKDVSRR